MGSSDAEKGTRDTEVLNGGGYIPKPDDGGLGLSTKSRVTTNLCAEDYLLTAVVGLAEVLAVVGLDDELPPIKD